MIIFPLATWLRARFAREERGASLVEYLLLLSLIAMAVIGAVIFLGQALSDSYENAGSRLNTP